MAEQEAAAVAAEPASGTPQQQEAPSTEQPAPATAVGDTGKQEQKPAEAAKPEPAPDEKRIPYTALEQKYRKLEAEFTRRSQKLAQYEKSKEQPTTDSREQPAQPEPAQVQRQRSPFENIPDDDPAAPAFRQLIAEREQQNQVVASLQEKLALHEQWLFEREMERQIDGTRRDFDADGIKLDENAIRKTIEENELELTPGLVKQLAMELQQNEVLVAQQRKGAKQATEEMTNARNTSSPAATGAHSVGKQDDSDANGNKSIAEFLGLSGLFTR